LSFELRHSNSTVLASHPVNIMFTYEHVFIIENNKQIHVLQSNLYKYIVCGLWQSCGHGIRQPVLQWHHSNSTVLASHPPTVNYCLLSIQYILFLIIFNKIIKIDVYIYVYIYIYNKGNNKITELRTILQRESQNS
jgi:hypothetical protein